MYFSIMRDVPPNTMAGVILWLFAALPPSVLAVLAFQFGPSLRNYAERKASAGSQPPKLASRLRAYFLILIVVILATVRVGGTLLERKIVAATSILHFFYLDLALLGFCIAANEVRIWRAARHDPRG
jgi:hypothetical protein